MITLYLFRSLYNVLPGFAGRASCVRLFNYGLLPVSTVSSHIVPSGCSRQRPTFVYQKPFHQILHYSHRKKNKKTMRKAIASSLPLSVCFPLECVGFQTSLLCSFPCFLFSTPPDHPNAPPASPTSPDTHNTRTSQTHTHSPTTQTDTHTHTHQRRWGTLPPTRDCPSLSS